MKLATYKDDTRDGRLVVVARDLKTACFATGSAMRMQQLLDDWNRLSPQLQKLADALNAGEAAESFPFDATKCMSPLPRAYQWADGSVFVKHVELVRRARNAEMPEEFYTDPLVYQGGSDDFLGPCDDAVVPDEKFGIDFEAEVAVITGDIAMGSTPEQALEDGAIRLVLLVNDWTLRNLVPGEIGKGFGFFQSKPATAFSPVAVTLDEVDEFWRGGRLHVTVQSTWNDRIVGRCEAGPEMTFHFGQLIAHICKTRNVRAGSIVGSGTISNQDRSHGYSCIAEQRAIETIDTGKPVTDFMKFGDTIAIESLDNEGRSIFGAIQQRVRSLADCEVGTLIATAVGR